MAEAKKGGGSNGKGAKGKKPKGKESDAQSAAKKKAAESNPEAPLEQPKATVDNAETAEAIVSDVPEIPEVSESPPVVEPSAPTETPVQAESSSPAPTAKVEKTTPPSVDSEALLAKKLAQAPPAEGKMQQQRVSRILDAVLDEPVQESEGHHGFKHPLFLDVILAVGLLVAMAGFSIGMFKIYITHSAKQSINQQNYRAAIALLKGTPLPGFFNIAGSEDSIELLNRALYLDAISKLEINRDDAGALEELQQIRPGSGYFELAQDLLRDNSPPPKMQLEGGAIHDANPSDPEVKEAKPIVPDDDLKDASP
ncbi:MAG: hypothetical protein C0507_04710 [Cyanobacteria bacterium PR.3.49]|nr:hypothetical protein [Cyanobacteria bacterium PR.3.49]